MDAFERATLAENTKHARRRALLALDDDDRAEVARFEQANELSTACGSDGWVDRYTQALEIYNEIITAHGGEAVA